MSNEVIEAEIVEPSTELVKSEQLERRAESPRRAPRLGDVITIVARTSTHFAGREETIQTVIRNARLMALEYQVGVDGERHAVITVDAIEIEVVHSVDDRRERGRW